ncbi:hypothetical protein BB561_005766 [Smittium simulii]|uniref:alpha,alpha-trehalose-phosphate synthase (UDP-forming) n=1 Tax=Smittium simulii TaxID=133385 RepID=A0A2T9Y8E5_9FUNG|nr:hypothetical protein BB561_005766 [Smittium simulii]
MTDPNKKTGRLIVVSNRLPVTITQNGASWDISLSSGGLVTALSGLKKEYPFTWVGWPGQDFKESERTKLSDLLEQNSCVPVFIDSKIADLHYNGFSNSVLWPLFHYHPMEMNYQDQAWDAYQLANESFANVILNIAKEGDIIWIHDYHLMLLARILQKGFNNKRQNIQIGWFLHTPFPSSEIYRILPVRQELLEGVLSADLIGFHTYEYSRHFLSSCTRVLGLQAGTESVQFEGRDVKIGTFPIGIDPIKFTDAKKTQKVIDRIAEFKKQFKDKKIIVGVDRLDYIKGVPQKFLAYENFLKTHPEYIGKVVLVQVAVPSRGDVEEYQDLMVNVNELVGLINGKYGTVEYTPIHFLHKSINFSELVSLYSVSDACLITSTRDGMNLVSYEYVACQEENNGVLILSEFAGAANSLNGSLIINPWDANQVSAALYQALSMDSKTKYLNHKMLFKYIQKHTAAFWGTSFVSSLIKTNGAMYSVYKIPLLTCDFAVHEFINSKGVKVLFITYDGTLSKTCDIPELAAPRGAILDILKNLIKLPKTLVYIISGRSRKELLNWFNGLDLGLIAEYGCFFRHPSTFHARRKTFNSKGNLVESPKHSHYAKQFGYPVELDDMWFKLIGSGQNSWHDTIIPLFQHYTKRTPGSFIEKKEVVITWHYRMADPEFGLFQAKELQVNLEKVLAHLPLSITIGNKALEVRPYLFNSTTALKHILSDVLHHCQTIGLLIAGGSSKQDESIFNYFNSLNSTSNINSTITFTVGKKQTEANFYVKNVADTLEMLKNISLSFKID